MFTKSFFVAAALIAVGLSAPLQPRACTPGQYNCLDGKSFQQCVVGGTWSVVMQSAAGTACRTGISENPWLQSVDEQPALAPASSAPAAIASSIASSAQPSPPAADPSTTQGTPSAVTTSVASQHTDSPPPPPPSPPAVSLTTSVVSTPSTSTAPAAVNTNPVSSAIGQFTDLSAWPSWESMKAKYKNVMGTSCQASWNIANNSPEETQQVFDAIEANSGTVDKRYLLAIAIQESSGCVRVPTTNNGVRNPGLLQDSNGVHTCNDAGKIQNPCPKDQIDGMIKDGVTGGDNNFSKALATAIAAGYQGATAYAVAARIYNSGSYDASNLSNGLGSTASYVTSVMSRVAGSLL